jgi:hypothetical protein
MAWLFDLARGLGRLALFVGQVCVMLVWLVYSLARVLFLDR